MKNKVKTIMLGILLIGLIGTTVRAAVPATQTFGAIIVQPTAPEPQTTITITVAVNGGTPEEVRMRIEECNGNTGICYQDVQNVSMTPTIDNSYTVQVLLKHADATYISCQALLKNNNIWSLSAIRKVNLTVSGNGTDGDGKKTPGFELVILLGAIAVSVILIGRKRFG